jgi:hypothetical protein
MPLNPCSVPVNPKRGRETVASRWEVERQERYKQANLYITSNFRAKGTSLISGRYQGPDTGVQPRRKLRADPQLLPRVCAAQPPFLRCFSAAPAVSLPVSATWLATRKPTSSLL